MIAGILVIAGLVVGTFLLSLILAIPFGLVVMLAWNFVVPTTFGLPQIDWGQGTALYLLANLLIRSTSTSSSK